MRRDGIGVNVYHIVASRVAPDLIEAQMMGVLRSTAFGLDPRWDWFVVEPVVVRVRGGRKEGQPGSERDDRTIHACALGAPTHAYRKFADAPSRGMLVSIAISLKRIAETMHRQDQPDAYGLKGSSLTCECDHCWTEG